MNKEIFQQLADVKKEMDKLKEKESALRLLVEDEMNKNELEKVESDFGTFYFTTRKKWSYSDNVSTLENQVKEEKKKEEKEGIAKAKETKSLTYRSNG